MLYCGFITLPRSVFWSASFNGRSDNADVIRLNQISMREIVSTTDTNSGSPRIDGTRLTCANVAQSLWYGFERSIDSYLGTHDNLSPTDILNCLNYCSRKQCVADDVHSYCEQCTLDKRPADPELARKYDECLADDLEADDSEDIWKISRQLLLDDQFDQSSLGTTDAG